MINIKNILAAMSFLYCFALGGCASAHFSDAYFFESKPGRPGQPLEKEVNFVLKTGKSVTIGEYLESIEAGKPAAKLKITGIFDEKNTMHSVQKPIPPGNYRIKATTTDKELAVSDHAIFNVSIDGKNVQLKTRLKNAQLKK